MTRGKAKQQEHPAGATLHLGGNAWAHPDLADLLCPIDKVTPYPGNPRRGDQDAITASITDLGLYRAVIAQRSTNHVLAGNHTLRSLIELGATQVPVTWVDVDDQRAAAVVARDNRTSDLGTYDDEALVTLLSELAPDAEMLALTGYTADDLDTLQGLLTDDADEPGAGPVYTRNMGTIHYEPTAETPPPPAELVDHSKTSDLVARIYAAELPPDVTDFLVAGAQRHLTFDYAKIAEFYAHATPDVQALMEQSALVLIDFEDAIANGYVRLSARLTELLDLDLEYRATLGKRSDSLRDTGDDLTHA